MKQNKKSNTLTIEETYKKKDVHNHVLSEPDMWMGSIQSDKKEMWIYDDENGMIKKVIDYVPGLYKIYDEIIVNARDQSVRDKNCNIIKVSINKNDGMISVWNNGNGVPIQIHKEYNIYVPELIFANLMTSTNYDTKGKITGGKNGLGAKLTNIYSTEFTINTVDSDVKKSYCQKCENNMYTVHPPTIQNSKEQSSTEIKFIPDYKKFGLDGLTDDIIGLFKKRVYDLAGCTNNKVRVFLNDKEIKIKSFDDYICQFVDKKSLVYEEVNDRWRIGAVFDPINNFNQISFVNGISTFQGGTHIKYIMDQICSKIINVIKSKNKKVNVKYSHVMDNITLFVDCIIEDPSFNSQSKEFLGSKVSNYGSECVVSDEFIKKLINTGLVDEVIRLAQFKEESELKKTDGKKVSSLRDIPKLEDAKWAGTRKSKYTRLILTEGDSAKSFAISGLEVLGREKYGVFPLKGKPINVRDATASQLKKNSEFINLKKILGLKQGAKYNDVSKLRYGGIVILTDQDQDGSHIKGLLINMIHKFWPSLLKMKGFIQSLATPIIKVYKKTDKKKQDPLIFYTITDYRKWLERIDDIEKWSKPKYYKGLGTSSEKEAMECFSDIENKIINYTWEFTDQIDKEEIEENINIDNNENEDDELNENEDDVSTKEDIEEEDDDDINDIYSKSYEAILLAFEKKKANNRKVWLQNYNKNNILGNHAGDITISDFINKDMMHFSNYDNYRSLPSICDGLKPSLRKILYASFKRKIENEEIKVAQLGAYVAETTDYHHGEDSLFGAIINMAQNFVGSNNLNLLYPSGNFGTRRNGGKDSASPRYIFTKLSPITSFLFRKEDNPILIKQYEDENENNDEIEPVNYSPILPTVLINGATGIGTGFSVNIPQFNPKDIANNILMMLEGKEPVVIHPWYRGFQGKIFKVQDKKNNEIKYQTNGIYEILDNNVVRITELPIGEWTEKYVETMREFIFDKKGTTKQFLDDVQNDSGNNKIDIKLIFRGNSLQTMIKNGTIEKELKLTNTISLSNMHLHNANGKICKYDVIEDIFYDFYSYRLDMYKKRKVYMGKYLENYMNILKYKMMFIEDYRKEVIILKGKEGDEVLNKLKELKYPKLSNDAYASEENKSYNYLTTMQIWSLTKEKIIELNNDFVKSKKEYDDYMNTSVEDLWRREILEFIEKYNKWLIDTEAEFNNDNKKKKTDNRKIKVKSKKN